MSAPSDQELDALRRAQETFKVLQSMSPEERLAYGKKLKAETVRTMKNNVNIGQFLKMDPIEYFEDQLAYYSMSTSGQEVK